jgi:glycosyltransferase involved in cell wall biosynthesis
MRVLFTLEYYTPHIGGAEVLFKNLCERLVTKGHDITVVTLRLPGTLAFEVINGVKVHRVKAPHEGARYWFTFLSIPKVFRLTKQADLSHTTTYNGAFPAWLSSRLRNKGCIITVHEIFASRWKDMMGMGWFMAKLHQFLERLIIALPFSKYIAISRYTANCLRASGVDQRKIVVIYNGIDYDLFNPKKVDGKVVKQQLNLGDEFIYMCYGRPGISKGVEYLIEAVPLISKRIPKSRLVILLGKDPSDRYQHIKRMIKNLGIEDKIILLAPVPRSELPSYIAASDCVVVPSLSEGFGFSAAEACAMGKPVVASNVASLPEVVSGKYVLIKPENPRAIAKGVEDIYNNRFKESSQKTFSWDTCIDNYLEVYKDVRHAKHKDSRMAP